MCFTIKLWWEDIPESLLTHKHRAIHIRRCWPCVLIIVVPAQHKNPLFKCRGKQLRFLSCFIQLSMKRINKHHWRKVITIDGNNLREEILLKYEFMGLNFCFSSYYKNNKAHISQILGTVTQMKAAWFGFLTFVGLITTFVSNFLNLLL